MKHINQLAVKKPTSTIVRKTTVAMVVAACLSTSAIAGNDYASDSFSHYDYARVIDVSKIVEKVRYTEPVEKCWNEKVRYRNRHASHNSKTPDVIGAIVGAAVGNRIGKSSSSSGRDAATVAGALLGGSIGRDIRKRNHRHHDEYHTKTVRQCETHEKVRYEEQIAGYEVKYRYHGKVFTTQMDTHPGREIKVQVTVVPVQ